MVILALGFMFILGVSTIPDDHKKPEDPAPRIEYYGNLPKTVK